MNCPAITTRIERFVWQYLRGADENQRRRRTTLCHDARGTDCRERVREDHGARLRGIPRRRQARTGDHPHQEQQPRTGMAGVRRGAGGGHPVRVARMARHRHGRVRRRRLEPGHGHCSGRAGDRGDAGRDHRRRAPPQGQVRSAAVAPARRGRPDAAGRVGERDRERLDRRLSALRHRRAALLRHRRRLAHLLAGRRHGRAADHAARRGDIGTADGPPSSRARGARSAPGAAHDGLLHHLRRPAAHPGQAARPGVCGAAVRHVGGDPVRRHRRKRLHVARRHYRDGRDGARLRTLLAGHDVHRTRCCWTCSSRCCRYPV